MSDTNIMPMRSAIFHGEGESRKRDSVLFPVFTGQPVDTIKTVIVDYRR
jgi:hypothetical protein